MTDAVKRFEEAYAIMGDGSMTGCLGKNCPSSCCWQKTVEGIGGQLTTGMTSLVGREEAIYQQTVLTPSLEDLEVKIHLNATRGRNGTKVQLLLDNCQNADGSCKLKDRKPLRCRMFPFNLDSIHDTARDCPRTGEICNDPELIRKIEEVRRLFKVEE